MNVVSLGKIQDFLRIGVCETTRLTAAHFSNRNTVVIAHLDALSDLVIRDPPPRGPLH